MTMVRDRMQSRSVSYVSDNFQKQPTASKLISEKCLQISPGESWPAASPAVKPTAQNE